MKRWTIRRRRGIGDESWRPYDLKTPAGSVPGACTLCWRDAHLNRTLGLDPGKPYELRYRNAYNEERVLHFATIAAVRLYLNTGERPVSDG